MPREIGWRGQALEVPNERSPAIRSTVRSQINILMKIYIKKGGWWTYHGPGEGKGLKHMITGTDGGNVTTWSEPSRESYEGGMSWNGPVDVFIQHFRPC